MAEIVVTKDDLKKCVVDAFFILLAEKGYADLTITSLVKKAGVSLKYFYANFGSREAVVEYFSDKVCNGFDHSTKIAGDYGKQLEAFLTYLLSFKDKFLLIHKNNLTYLLQPTINRYNINRKTSEKLSFEEELLLLTYASNFFNLMSLWFSYGMRQKPEIGRAHV
jgi:AcrR family transcriptional regulator